MNPTHAFDQATRLQPQADGRFSGHTHIAYQNMVGPYGGITAANMLASVLQHPQLLGEPIAITVNFAGAVADGPFEIEALPVRTNRSTQHWAVTQRQVDAQGQTVVSTTATVVTAARRRTWSASDEPLPEGLPSAEAMPRRVASPGPAWFEQYDMRIVTGGLPTTWDGREAPALTRMWVRDEPPRPRSFASLVALADTFMPVLWLRRAKRVPIGTVSMTVYFHADGAQLAGSGDEHLFVQAQGHGFRHGFFDHSGQLWDAAGMLLATTTQIVYFKD